VLTQSVASLQLIRYQVTATLNGAPYNPVTDVVQFGFTTGVAQNITPTSWVPGSWETDALGTGTIYVARCLVGPTGDFIPEAGTRYNVWIKITDSPEQPVIQVGQLQIN
jgi:hypothetical protein